MAPDQVEQALDELTKRVERLEAKEPSRAMCLHCGRPMERVYHGHVGGPPGWICRHEDCQCRPPGFRWPDGHPFSGLAGNDY